MICQEDRIQLEKTVSRSPMGRKWLDRLHGEAKEILENPKRVDRWLTLAADGDLFFTTRDESSPQSELSYIPGDLEVDTDEAALGALVEAITDVLVGNRFNLKAGDDNRILRVAYGEEVVSYWLEGWTETINCDVRNITGAPEDGDCWVEFSR